MRGSHDRASEIRRMSAEYLEQLFSLAGQSAVVIGGTGVLGGALCEGLAKAGAFVVVAGRSEERGGERVEAIERLGGEAIYLPVDATSRQSIGKLLGETAGRRTSIDVLVNCAGVNSATGYDRISEDEWQRVVDGNLTATHLACQTFAPYMAGQSQGGSILNIGSVTAHLPLSRVFAYSAAKAAIVNLTKNLAREYAPSGVRVNVLCPGFFPAEQNREILDEERVAHIMRGTPMARFGEPHELVGAALLLLSRAAGSFITGAALYVDGGFTAMRF
jgi:NAD(P)-dependent dehydrogenase (short-subunit alcohol dehydrogenase family)